MWRKLGSFTLNCHLSSVEDLFLQLVYRVVVILTVISFCSVPEAIAGNSGCQKRVSVLPEKTCHVFKRSKNAYFACAWPYVRANSGGSFESLNVSAICRCMLITSGPGPLPFIPRPDLAIARSPSVQSRIFVRALLV